MAPSPAATNGRGQLGRFATGNKIAKGNPHAAKVQKLRTAMLSGITEKNVRGIIAKLVTMAAAGDIAAAKLILSTIGRPTEGDTTEAPTIPVTPEITPNNFERIKRELLARTN